MCIVCDQNAKVAQAQQQMQQRTHAINHRLALANTTPQLSTQGINQQLAIQAYQQRIENEVRRKAGIKSSNRYI